MVKRQHLRFMLATGGLTVVVVASAACAGRGSTSPTTAVPSTSIPAPTTSVPAATTSLPATTTVYSPTMPQPSPDNAAIALVTNWSEGNRAGAATVAVPAATAALFAATYPAGALQDRGCTAASVSPGTCTYRNTDTDGLYEIGVTHGPSGWYVSSVDIEN